MVLVDVVIIKWTLDSLPHNLHHSHPHHHHHIIIITTIVVINITVIITIMVARSTDKPFLRSFLKDWLHKEPRSDS